MSAVLREMCVRPDCRLDQAIERLDRAGYGSLFITDASGKMLGLLTDGDLRKAVLARTKLSAPISKVMNREFLFGTAEEPRQKWVHYLKQIKRRQLPILKKDRTLVDVILLDELSYGEDDTQVVLMAGGLGSRLKSLTEHTPKPMVRLGGEKPILETVIEGLVAHNLTNFLISVN